MVYRAVNLLCEDFNNYFQLLHLSALQLEIKVNYYDYLKLLWNPLKNKFFIVVPNILTNFLCISEAAKITKLLRRM